MSAPTIAWDETSPSGSQSVSLGDDRIREMKTQLREILDVDHEMSSSGSGTDWGKHNKVSLLEQADIGTGVSTKPILGAQTDSLGNPELCYTGEDDVDLFLTRGGKIFLDNGRLSNNVNLIARNAAGNGDINILKVNASNTITVGAVTTLPDTSALASSAAPAADAQIANKKYVDDKVAAVPAQVGFGARVSKSVNTAYLAATDGIVTAYLKSSNNNTALSGLTDSSNPPTTLVAYSSDASGASSGSGESITFTVKKGEYYKVTYSVADSFVMYFTPLGS